MFNVIPFRAARNLMNTSMDDMLSDRFFRHFFDMSDMVGTAGFRVDVKEQPDAYVLEAELPGVKQYENCFFLPGHVAADLSEKQ